MKDHFLSLILILLMTAFAISCKKDEEEKLSRKQLLTAQAWKLDKVLANGLEVTDPRALEAIGAFRNSSFLFKPDGTYVATDNSSGNTTSGTWELQDNDTKLFVKSSSENYTFTIKELAQNTLNLTTPFTVGPPFFPVELNVTAEIQMIPVK